MRTRSTTAGTRATSAVRIDKFEKARACRSKSDVAANASMELEDDAFADFDVPPPLPSFKDESEHATEHRYIGSPTRSSQSVVPKTPFAELQARALRLRAAGVAIAKSTDCVIRIGRTRKGTC